MDKSYWIYRNLKRASNVVKKYSGLQYIGQLLSTPQQKDLYSKLSNIKVDLSDNFTKGMIKKVQLEGTQLVINDDLHYVNVQNDSEFRFPFTNDPDLKNTPLKVRGNIIITAAKNLSFPDNLNVKGYLNLSGSSFTNFPTFLKGTDINLTGCLNLTAFPKTEASGFVDLSHCINLESLSEGSKIDGDLDLSNCGNLQSLPNALALKGNLNLRDCGNLNSLSDWVYKLEPHQKVYLSSENEAIIDEVTLRLEKPFQDQMPTFIVDGNFDYIFCENSQTLPEKLIIKGDLDLRGCDNLMTLPEWVYKLEPHQKVYLSSENEAIIDEVTKKLEESSQDQMPTFFVDEDIQPLNSLEDTEFSDDSFESLTSSDHSDL